MLKYFKYLWRRHGPNPFDQLLKKAQEKGQKRVLLCWNRGLGDIPLGLYALTERIRTYLSEADITFVTRSDLGEGFKLLSSVTTYVDPLWKRRERFDLNATLLRLGKKREEFDLIIEDPDPTRWLVWQLGRLTPRLRWDPAWDALASRLLPESEGIPTIGLHVQTETHYDYEKNWPLDYWRALIDKLTEGQRACVLLFGFSATPVLEGEGVCDLRGKTSLLELLSLIKNRCPLLVLPDSGILSMAYYLDVSFPLDIVSLWADPRQGVLKQKVASPNRQLRHTPLIAPQGDLRKLSVSTVWEALNAHA